MKCLQIIAVQIYADIPHSLVACEGDVVKNENSEGYHCERCRVQYFDTDVDTDPLVQKYNPEGKPNAIAN